MAARCPHCGGETRLTCVSPDRNRRTTKQQFRYERCEACGLVVCDPQPTDLARFYPQDYQEPPRLEELAATARRYHDQLDLVRAHAPGGRLVEIGASWGAFAWKAAEAGYEVDAVEMDERCCTYLASITGVTAVQADDPAATVATLAPSDAVVMWQVLEHLAEPWLTLERAVDNLRPGGVLVIATPNPESLGFRLLRSWWVHLDAPRHLFLFPADVLSDFLSSKGAVLVEQRFSDSDARRWNVFGWQRLFMNPLKGRWPRRIGAAAGLALALAMSPIENRGRNGSSYTAVFRKTGS